MLNMKSYQKRKKDKIEIGQIKDNLLPDDNTSGH